MIEMSDEDFRDEAEWIMEMSLEDSIVMALDGAMVLVSADAAYNIGSPLWIVSAAKTTIVTAVKLCLESEDPIDPDRIYDRCASTLGDSGKKAFTAIVWKQFVKLLGADFSKWEPKE